VLQKAVKNGREHGNFTEDGGGGNLPPGKENPVTTGYIVGLASILIIPVLLCT
jgi:hypothetical protein